MRFKAALKWFTILEEIAEWRELMMPRRIISGPVV